MINSHWKWTTNVKITVRDLQGKVLEVKEIHNLLTTVGLGMVIDLMQAGGPADGKIRYMGVGSNATPPAIAQTQLIAETFRKAVTSQAEITSTSLRTIVYIAPAEAVGWIKEIGWFSSPTAGAGANTGIMISRILYSRNKTALESIQVDRVDTIAEA
uniref:Uncharacterized protein n=1 Tax=viral metagenome TaxID=1070528 RepID=A0A6M3KLA5_9ZZZZ